MNLKALISRRNIVQFSLESALHNALISITVLPTLAILSLSGCMHGPMMSGHGDEMKTDSAIEKLIIENNVAVSARIPPMKENETNEVTILVQVADSKTPITGADVSYHWMPAKGSGHEHSPSAMTDGTMLTGSAKEGTAGTYSFTLSDQKAGRYMLAITVTADSSAKPMVFELERTIPMQHDMGMGMMGMSSSGSSSWIIGGAIMVSMMIVMWAVRGGM